MRIKKFLAIILIAVLTLSQSIVLAAAEPAAGPVFEVGVEAATATPISLSPVLINKGDKVSVKLNIKKNDGISIASMYLEYDSSLFGVEKSDIKPAGLDDSFVFGSNIDNNGVKLYIYTTSVDTYYTGELCEITFTAKAGCSDASSELFHLRKAGQGKPITNTNFDDVELNSNAVNVLVHEITKDGIVTAPTCTADGYTTYTCDDCGAEIKTDTVKALGHSYDNGVVTTVSTCTDKGVKTFTCTRTGCTDSYTEEVAALGHDLVSHEAKAPTCTEIGWDAYDTCSRCDYTTYVEKAALGHDLVNHEAKAPTCTEIGWDAYDTCSRCDYTTYVEKAALGHDLVNHEAKAPTCTEIGWDAYDTCSRCDYNTYKEIKANGHDYGDATCTQAATCKICGATSGTAIGHKWDDGVVTTAPTCTAKGVKTFTCTRANCGATYTEDIDMFDHEMPDVYTTNNDGTHSKKCANCDYTETADCAYTDVVTAPTCTEKGYTTHTCNVCGYSYVDTYVDALGHAYDNGVVTTEPTCTEKGVKTFICTRTGCTASYTEEVAAKGHTDGTAEKTNVVEAKCTTEGSYDLVTKCTVCGEVTKTEHKTVAATGHTDGTAEKTNAVEAKCTTEGSHDLVTKCTVCGEVTKTEHKTVAAKGHTAGTPAEEDRIEATCEADGSYNLVTRCSVCNEIISSEAKTIPAIGHKWNDGEITTAATCTKEGVKTYTCLNDSTHTKTEAVAAKGHTDGTAEKTNVVEAKCTTAGSYDLVTKCTVCGEVTKTEHKTVAATGHNYMAVVTAPTCTEKGYTTYTCDKCADSYKADETEALGHSYDDGVVTTAPTCTNKGVKTFTCTRKGCADSYTEEVVALGHDIVKHEAKAPTCTEIGWDAYDTCSRCDYTTYVEKAALGHSEAEAVKENEVAATTKTTGSYDSVVYCSVCGVKLSSETVVTDKIPEIKIDVKSNDHLALVNGILVIDKTVTEKDIFDNTNATQIVNANDTENTDGVLKTEMKANVFTGAELTDSIAMALLGDVDCDGDVDVADARLALRAAVKLDILVGARFAAADVDFSSDISVSDARTILRIAVKLEDGTDLIAKRKAD